MLLQLNDQLTEEEIKQGLLSDYLNILEERAKYLYALVCAAFFLHARKTGDINALSVLGMLAEQVENPNEAVYIGAKVTEVYIALCDERNHHSFKRTLFRHIQPDEEITMNELARRFSRVVTQEPAEV